LPFCRLLAIILFLIKIGEIMTDNKKEYILPAELRSSLIQLLSRSTLNCNGADSYNIMHSLINLSAVKNETAPIKPSVPPLKK